MKKLSIIGFILCSTLVFANQKHQNQRIKAGVKSGELTKEEAQELRQDRREYREDRKEAMSDGSLSKEERQNLRQERMENSRKIHELKHNANKR